ncbi:hypothetical protein EJ04DRAFT_337814 [Polyplosphaeria fusca]|uniref:Uncharacterized protein n=1 Tax=Polyplosphaeria fusca TaxID=682080 RepID=A0A9P4UXQ5_9PLEO|nr:hypothetical protein EJ04DRAFT_337814 [Polyplosphaeria fusca]
MSLFLSASLARYLRSPRHHLTKSQPLCRAASDAKRTIATYHPQEGILYHTSVVGDRRSPTLQSRPPSATCQAVSHASQRVRLRPPSPHNHTHFGLQGEGSSRPNKLFGPVRFYLCRIARRGAVVETLHAWARVDLALLRSATPTATPTAPPLTHTSSQKPDRRFGALEVPMRGWGADVRCCAARSGASARCDKCVRAFGALKRGGFLVCGAKGARARRGEEVSRTSGDGSRGGREYPGRRGQVLGIFKEEGGIAVGGLDASVVLESTVSFPYYEEVGLGAES